jgi:hypothetical protein
MLLECQMRNKRYSQKWPYACLFIVCLAGVALSQSFSSGEQALPNDLVRATIANELRTQPASESHWMYRVERKEPGKTTGKEVIQTDHGSIERLVSVDGRPLGGNQELEETNRIQSLVKNVTEQRRMEQTRKKEAQQCEELFKLIPEAFIFTYAGTERKLVKLNYQPNPDFQPPTREARVFHELTGEMWIDATQRRLVRMRGQLRADVKFAGGLLGYLQKGGHFDVEQQELSPTRWELTSLDVEMQGKALLFKTIAIQQKERRTNFRTVPAGLSLADAAEMLTKQVILAANH